MNIMITGFNYGMIQKYNKAPKYYQGLDFLSSYKEKHKRKGIWL